MFSQLKFLKYYDLLDYLLMVVDISLVAFVIYKGTMLIRGTRAVQLLKGLAVLVAASFASKRLGLTAINWMLDQTRIAILVALPIVFQPELRRALEQLGRGKFFARPLSTLGPDDMSRLIGDVIRAVNVLAKNKDGALIVIERETGLNDYIETGIKMDGVVTVELLTNVFVPTTPLHDGAAIIRGDRVAAAGCFLPLTDSPYLSSQLGTRHRAALGISEISDAVVVIVSEETGTISVAEEGKLTRYLDENTLRETLEDLLIPKSTNQHFWQWRS
ncbi:diadenylate cyclase CdaA [Metallumcola ferriviriculae]|uniref:Diadenylate cyclase n=1 Tax=Metallumcola ferriviriculae TaxID=3039180 RepID=A0AAU0UI45_9FIRM|nr:diadenylate cyclase CdaA [Desulfitibacteraceae bacterium MK1]